MCQHCERQFVEFYLAQGYPDKVKRQCLQMYVNGIGFRTLERVSGVHHTIVIHWVRQAALPLPDVPESNEIPEIAQADELETFVSSKKYKIWLWTAVNKHKEVILAWVFGDHTAQTFKHFWKIFRGWQSFWYVTNGYTVYQSFIDEAKHLMSKTYMAWSESENPQLRHYLVRLYPKTLCYSKSEAILKLSIRLLLHYLKYRTVTLPA